MKKANSWIWILALGSLWGLAEVAGEGLWAKEIPLASVWLTAIGFFLMGIGRSLLNKPGTSAAMGATAALFKLVNAAPYYCHLLGIVFLAVAFDIFATLILKKEAKASWRSALAGLLGAFTGAASFALVMTYVIQYRPWVVNAPAKLLNHVFVSAPVAAAASAVLVFLGFALGRSGLAFSEKQPKWAFAGALVLLAAFWALGRVV